MSDWDTSLGGLEQGRGPGPEHWESSEAPHLLTDPHSHNVLFGPQSPFYNVRPSFSSSILTNYDLEIELLENMYYCIYVDF